MNNRVVQLTVTTPYEGAQTVVCYQDTLINKIIPQKRVAGDPTPMIISTLSAPTFICAGTSNPGYIAYVNHNLRSPGSNHPFAVFVDPQGSPLPAVASIGFRRDLLDSNGLTILWQP